MLENIADGFLGLFMFFAHWISPGGSEGEIRIVALEEFASHTAVECVISFDWNSRMSDLIDAGIPMRMQVVSFSNAGDTTVSVRTLSCDVSEYSYTFSDSLSGYIDSTYISRKHSQIYRALREYKRIKRTFNAKGDALYIQATMLPSQVPHLNRSIDLSELCGSSRFSTHVIRKKDK